MPLNGKRPTTEAWSELTLEKCQELSLSNLNTGIGLLTGKINNIIAVDIDSDDKDFLKDFDCYSAIAKRGQKGITYFFQFIEGMESKSFPPFVDFLCDGRQTVLPPSIHPITKAPYYWIDEQSTLLTVNIDDIPVLSLKQYHKLIAVAQKHKEIFESKKPKMPDDKPSSGRNNHLVDVAFSIFYRNSGLYSVQDIIADTAFEVYNEDLKHEVPLFSDKTEFEKTFHEPEQNALNFVISNFRTFCNNEAKKVSNIKKIDFEEIAVEDNGDIIEFNYSNVPNFNHGILKDLYDYLEMRAKYNTHNLWVGSSLAVLSAQIGHLAILRTDQGDIGCNIFSLLVADSGIGKSTTIENAIDFLPRKRLVNSEFVSSSGMSDLVRDLGDYSESLFFHDEISTVFSKMKEGGVWQAGMIQNFINLYDKSRGNFALPIKAKGKVKTKEDGITFVENPFVSTLFATNQTSLYDSVDKHFTNSGFGARFLFFNNKAHRDLLKTSVPSDVWNEKKKELQNKFADIETVTAYAIGQSPANANVMNVKANPLVFGLDDQASSLFWRLSAINDELSLSEQSEALKAIKNRKNLNLLKVALIYSFSRQFEQIKGAIKNAMSYQFEVIEDYRFKLNQDDILFGHQVVETCLNNTESFLQIAASNTKSARIRREIEDAFKNKKFIADKDMASVFDFLTPREIKEYQKEAIDRGLIKETKKNKIKGYMYIG